MNVVKYSWDKTHWNNRNTHMSFDWQLHRPMQNFIAQTQLRPNPTVRLRKWLWEFTPMLHSQGSRSDISITQLAIDNFIHAEAMRCGRRCSADIFARGVAALPPLIRHTGQNVRFVVARRHPFDVDGDASGFNNVVEDLHPATNKDLL